MKISLLVTGKTEVPYLKEGIEVYVSRLAHYADFRLIEIPQLKNTRSLSDDQVRRLEAQAILARMPKADVTVLLDEKGKEMTSLRFAGFFQEKLNQSMNHFLFIVGGAYGFHSDIRKKADMEMSLSKMTFNHQMVRLFFVEQLYRAMTILRNEKYHNE